MAATTKVKARKRGVAPAARAMIEALGLGGSTIERTFALMRVAEEEIAEAKLRHPAWADALDGGFRALCPPEGMSGFDEKVYRAHVRELLGRVATPGFRADDVRLGTHAEAMLALSAGSLRHPLEAAHQALFEKLFAEVMGFSVDGGVPAREPFPGACDDVLRGLVRRLTRDRS